MSPYLQAIGMTFATYICTGLGYYRNFGSRQKRFRDSPVLSYLSPEYFKQDFEPLRRAGLDQNQPYIFIRTVSWSATHDISRNGTSTKQLHQIIDSLCCYGRILISSEEPLPDSLKIYENPVPVEHIHDLLAFANISLIESCDKLLHLSKILQKTDEQKRYQNEIEQYKNTLHIIKQESQQGWLW